MVRLLDPLINDTSAPRPHHIRPEDRSLVTECTRFRDIAACFGEEDGNRVVCCHILEVVVSGCVVIGFAAPFVGV